MTLRDLIRSWVDMGSRWELKHVARNERLFRSWVAAVKHEARADPEAALQAYLQAPAK